jgi:glyoxylase-like metal-dependent hydrolase (beta-lactamase superfamily II)
MRTLLVAASMVVIGASAALVMSSSAPARAPVSAPQGPLQAGTFPATWINGGPACPGEPAFQVHAYNPDFYILRQSLCTNFEAPFLFLVFGTQKAILFDSGAGGVPVQSTVQGIVNQWLAAHSQSSIQLVVAHLHSHGDHTAGDGQFNGQPNTTVVGTSLSAVQGFFGWTSTQWNAGQTKTYDLGGRVLDVIPIPGHQAQHIAVYDRSTGILLTGDSFYPGRLYVNGNWTAYKTSMQRLVTFGQTNPIAWILGTHIEMSTSAGVEFPLGSTSHPNEHALQLTYRHLLALNNKLQPLQNPQTLSFPSFRVVP